MNRDLGLVRIFVGTEPKTEIARRVLESSVTRRTDMRCEIVPMIGGPWEYPTEGIGVGTGFSLRRWLIPAYCGWRGRAIYMDADQVVLSDVNDLWTMPDRFGDREDVVWCTYQTDKHNPKVPAPQTSVMVINCEAAAHQWGFHREKMLSHLRDSPKGYADFMHASWLTRPAVKIPTYWNHLNEMQKGVTRLLHYTKEPEQPWYNPHHPQAGVWHQELTVAVNSGLVTADMLREALSKWNVKEDWRNTNGLHPFYEAFIPKPGRKKKTGP